MGSLVLNVIANMVGKAWPALLGILFVPLYIRFMGIEVYGLVGFYATLQGVLGLLDLGISATVLRELARLSVGDNSAEKQRDLVRTLEVIYWTMALAAGLTVACLAPWIAQYWLQAQSLSTETLVSAIRLMGVAIALQFPFAFYQGGLMGLQRQVLVNAVLLVVGTIRAGGAVLILWLVSPNISVFMGWQAVTGLVGSLTVMLILWRTLPKYERRPGFSLHLFKDLWHFAAAVAANGLIGVALTQTDKLILSHMLSLDKFAYYSLASTVASAVWMLIIPLNNAIFPKLAQLDLKGDREELARLFHVSSQYLSLLMFPVVAVLSMQSQSVLLLWTRDPVIAENARYLVTLLTVGTMINGVASIPAYAASAFGWPQLITKINLLQAVVLIPLTLILTYRYGAIGGAIVWILINCTYILFLLPRFFKKYLTQESSRWAWGDICLPAIMSYCGCCVSLKYLSLFSNTLPPALKLIIAWSFAIIMAGFVMGDVRAPLKRLFLAITIKFGFPLFRL